MIRRSGPARVARRPGLFLCPLGRPRLVEAAMSTFPISSPLSLLSAVALATAAERASRRRHAADACARSLLARRGADRSTRAELRCARERRARARDAPRASRRCPGTIARVSGGARRHRRSAVRPLDARRDRCARTARRSRSSARARRRRTRSRSPSASPPISPRAASRRQRPGARRRLGGAPRRARRRRRDDRGARLGRRRDLSARARARSRARSKRTGVVVSELVPGTPPLPLFFPLRNRIISGLSRAVVVIEAGEKSGSLITARCALEQGREVLAVPGNVLSGRNRGAHALLRDGAKIVESADDILEELGCRRRDAVAAVQANADRPERPRSGLSRSPANRPIWTRSPSDRGCRPPRLLPRLLRARTAGFVAASGGGRFVTG